MTERPSYVSSVSVNVPCPHHYQYLRMGKGRRYSRSESLQEGACTTLCLPVLGKHNAPLAALASPEDSPTEKTANGTNHVTDDKARPSDVEAASPDGTKQRETWSNPAEFVLSCLGYAVGLGNIWRFPYMVVTNGGGAFLIPYAVMLTFVGIPTFFMELIMGQYSGCGPITVWSFAPLFHGVGFGMVVVSSLFCIFYTMIQGYSLFFFFASFSSQLPWDSCQNDHNTAFCYNKREATPCEDINGTFFNKTCYNSTYLSLFDEERQLCNETSCYNYTYNYEKDLLSNNTDSRVHSAEEYMNNYVLSMSSAIDDFGETRWQLVLVLLASWLLCFLCLLKGIRSSGKVVYFTALFPYVVLTILLVWGVMLDGAVDGIMYYITPEWSKLAEPKIWADAAGQIFFSLSVGSGGLMTFSSYNKFNNNIYRDALIVSIGNCLTSFYAGFAIFAILGHMAFVLGEKVADVAVEGSTLAFVAYPTVVAQMPVSQLWAVLFFLMLITLGLDSLFAGMETVMTAIVDSFPRTRGHKTLMTFLLCSAFFLLGLPMCTEAGIYWLNLIAYYSGGWCLILIGLIETLVIGLLFGAWKLRGMVREMVGFDIYWHWVFAWVFLTPVLLIIILIVNLIDFSPLAFGPYILPDWAQALGWLMALTAPAFVLLFATVHVINTYYQPQYDGLNIFQRIKALCRPTPAWGPSYLKSDHKGAASTEIGEPATNGVAKTKLSYENSSFSDPFTTQL